MRDEKKKEMNDMNEWLAACSKTSNVLVWGVCYG